MNNFTIDSLITYLNEYSVSTQSRGIPNYLYGIPIYIEEKKSQDTSRVIFIYLDTLQQELMRLLYSRCFSVISNNMTISFYTSSKNKVKRSDYLLDKILIHSRKFKSLFHSTPIYINEKHSKQNSIITLQLNSVIRSEPSKYIWAGNMHIHPWAINTSIEIKIIERILYEIVYPLISFIKLKYNHYVGSETINLASYLSTDKVTSIGDQSVIYIDYIPFTDIYINLLIKELREMLHIHLP